MDAIGARLWSNPSKSDVSFFDVNAVELFILGRKLMLAAEDALPRGRIATSVRLVAVDIAHHPRSSVSEITERTGFPQSHVSLSVARLKELGVVATDVDPLDHRRTLVTMTPAAIDRAASANAVPIEQVLAPVLRDCDERVVAEVVDALELLAERMTPRAIGRLRAKVAS